MSSRLGKEVISKCHKTVYVVENQLGVGCGHQHSTQQGARNCGLHLKGLALPATIRAYLPANDRVTGRVEIPS